MKQFSSVHEDRKVESRRNVFQILANLGNISIIKIAEHKIRLQTTPMLKWYLGNVIVTIQRVLTRSVDCCCSSHHWRGCPVWVEPSSLSVCGIRGHVLPSGHCPGFLGSPGHRDLLWLAVGWGCLSWGFQGGHLVTKPGCHWLGVSCLLISGWKVTM
jgi:hypothetical protein